MSLVPVLLLLLPESLCESASVFTSFLTLNCSNDTGSAAAAADLSVSVFPPVLGNIEVSWMDVIVGWLVCYKCINGLMYTYYINIRNHWCGYVVIADGFSIKGD